MPPLGVSQNCSDMGWGWRVKKVEGIVVGIVRVGPLSSSCHVCHLTVHADAYGWCGPLPLLLLLHLSSQPPRQHAPACNSFSAPDTANLTVCLSRPASLPCRSRQETLVKPPGFYKLHHERGWWRVDVSMILFSSLSLMFSCAAHCCFWMSPILCSSRNPCRHRSSRGGFAGKQRFIEDGLNNVGSSGTGCFSSETSPTPVVPDVLTHLSGKRQDPNFPGGCGRRS